MNGIESECFEKYSKAKISKSKIFPVKKLFAGTLSFFHPFEEFIENCKN